MKTKKPSWMYQTLQENFREVGLLLMLGAVLVVVYTSWLKNDAPIESLNLSEQIHMTHPRMIEYQRELKSWELVGDDALVKQGQSVIQISKVKLDTYTPQTQNLDISLTSASAFLDWGKKEVLFKNNVHLNHTNGTRLQTESALYDYEQQYLNIPQEVLLESQKHSTLGYGLEYDMKEQQLYLKNPIFQSAETP